MLLLNRTLLRMARGLWGWILAITGLKLATLVATVEFAGIISGFLGNIASPALTVADASHAILSAFVTALAMLAAELLSGEAEYRCTAKARLVALQPACSVLSFLSHAGSIAAPGNAAVRRLLRPAAGKQCIPAPSGKTEE